jgi:hypothetical protein
LLVDDVPRLIYQVALNVDLFSLAIQKSAVGAFFKDGVTQRIHLIVALHFFDVKLGEREYFREFAVLKIFGIKKLLPLFIDYISSLIYKVAAIVDKTARLICKLAFRVSLEVYVAVFITLQLAANILNIKTTPIEAE